MAPTEDIRFQSDGLTLAGTLHRPEGPAPHPALVMLQGSGPTDRDSEGYFPPIRDCFLDAGLAVLSWDKPGIGESSGDWRERTLFDRAQEAVDALAWLRRRPGINPRRVGIWGHSQGGWVGPLAASRDPEAAFVIVSSGPGVTAAEQDRFGIEHTLRRDGASDDDVRHALRFVDALHAAAERGLPYERAAAEVLEPARGTPWGSYFGEITAEYWTFFVRNLQHPYDPVTALAHIRCPLLAVFGERDALVPVAESVRIFRAALATAGNPDVTIRVFPGADHRIRVGDPPAFASGYLDLLRDWLRPRVGPG